MTLVKLLNLPGTWFIHKEYKSNNLQLIESLERINKIYNIHNVTLEIINDS